MRHLTARRGAVAALILGATALAACNNAEPTYDSGSYFPQDWQTRYSPLAGYDCTLSPTHGNDYVRIWVSPEIKDFYEGRAEEAPEGSVALKEQFSDARCRDFTRFTVMKRASDKPTGWDWQRITEDGSVEFNTNEGFCVDCHIALPTCVDYVCARE